MDRERSLALLLLWKGEESRREEYEVKKTR